MKDNPYPTNASKDLKVDKVSKPCNKLKYCPYGPLVEQYPLLEKRDAKSCKTFGHQCPAYYVSEKAVG